ncbi:hypothetical protein NC651_037117 [Populus alba x Populus x berolinensis]|nr:hypothetical protein NC651_037117 [Populus alba x Populus x berolinensis]
MDSMVALAFWVTQPIWQMNNRVGGVGCHILCERGMLFFSRVSFFFPSIALSLCFLCSIMLFFSSFFHHYLYVLGFAASLSLCSIIFFPSFFHRYLFEWGCGVVKTPPCVVFCFVFYVSYNII